MVKPRIMRRSGRWICHNDHQIYGTGRSPREAYFRWLDAFHNRTRIRRHGIWNKRSCNSWYRRGCPSISSYVGGKRIVGYDWMRDELILQG